MQTQKVVIYIGVDAQGNYSSAGWKEEGKEAGEDSCRDCILDMVGDPYALYKVICEVPLPHIQELVPDSLALLEEK